MWWRYAQNSARPLSYHPIRRRGPSLWAVFSEIPAEGASPVARGAIDGSAEKRTAQEGAFRPPLYFFSTVSVDYRASSRGRPLQRHRKWQPFRQRLAPSGSGAPHPLSGPERGGPRPAPRRRRGSSPRGRRPLRRRRGHRRAGPPRPSPEGPVPRGWRRRAGIRRRS